MDAECIGHWGQLDENWMAYYIGHQQNALQDGQMPVYDIPLREP